MHLTAPLDVRYRWMYDSGVLSVLGLDPGPMHLNRAKPPAAPAPAKTSLVEEK